MVAAAATDTEGKPAAAWGAVLSMALCVAMLIASEFMPVSLLTPMAEGLRATEGQTGQAISISGLFAVAAIRCALKSLPDSSKVENMLATVRPSPSDIRCEDVAEPKILKPTDANVKPSATCICGSDLWPFRGLQPLHGRPMHMDHEYCGVVVEVGSAVKSARGGYPRIAPTDPRNPLNRAEPTSNFALASLCIVVRNAVYYGELVPTILSEIPRFRHPDRHSLRLGIRQFMPISA